MKKVAGCRWDINYKERMKKGKIRMSKAISHPIFLTYRKHTLMEINSKYFRHKDIQLDFHFPHNLGLSKTF